KILVLMRVTLDQAIFAPCFITTFFVGQALLEGQEKISNFRKDWRCQCKFLPEYLS
ncbi:hypothetical protein C1646_630789, partial [Rhizophagus diaphanus]